MSKKNKYKNKLTISHKYVVNRFGSFSKTFRKSWLSYFYMQRKSFPDTILCCHSSEERKNIEKQGLFMFLCRVLLCCSHLPCIYQGTWRNVDSGQMCVSKQFLQLKYVNSANVLEFSRALCNLLFPN